MSPPPDLIPASDTEIQSRILTIRGVQVMLDRDLAALYGVGTKVLNQAVKRNSERFPEGFMFRLAEEEWTVLRSQSVTSKRGGQRYHPYAFTEHGIVMLASVLKSDMAVQASIRIVRVFVSMRHTLLTLAPLLMRIEAAERRQIVDQTKNEVNQKRNEERFEKIFDAMNDKRFPPQKVFFNGEFFEAFVQMKKFIRQAKRTLVVIDPYFDDSCLPLVAQKRPGVSITVVRSSVRATDHLHAADIDQFNLQYDHSLMVKLVDTFHDRYLIIDNATLIHVGASLNHLGKRCFAFSTLDAAFIPDILARIR